MKTRTPSLLALGSLLLVLVAVVGISSMVLASSTLAGAANATAAQESVNGVTITALPDATCTLVGSTRTCDLWAKTGTLDLPDGATVPIWGFADSAVGPAQLPGPMLIANAGETLQVVLHNELAGETVSLAFPGQSDQVPDLVDLVGVAPGSSKTYTIAVDAPGTFLYEAGLTENGARQVAMGLYGGLIVRPVTPTQAYNSVATAFDDEMLLVLSEIDPLLNADPNNFVLTEYAPRYWLINGQAFSQTAEIDTVANNTVLLRYINAGLETHWMGLLGVDQEIIASDGRPMDLSRQVVAETIASGQTVDALVRVPAQAVEGTRYALYDTNLLLHNANQRYAPDGPLAFGGMMTFLHVLAGAAPFDGGPVATLVDVSPSPTTGDAGVTLTVRLEASTGDVTAVEYFTNTLGAVETGVPLAVTAAPVVTVEQFLPAATLANWSSDYHTFYVRGKDTTGNWGPVNSDVLNLDKTGPSVHGMSLWPEPSNGQLNVLLRATGDDRSSGRNNVVAATYSIDGGADQPLSLKRNDAPVTAMTATLLSDPTLLALPEGLHPVAITAEDSLGNLGAPGTISLTLDRTGPQAPFVTLTPDYLDLSGAPPVTNVRLEASLTDTLSAGVQTALANAEAWIGDVGADGTGFKLFPKDGLFDEIAEDAYFDIPLANFIVLPDGEHTVSVHGLDVAGNWGTLGTATILIDRGEPVPDEEGPIITSGDVAPNPTNGEGTVTLSAVASDPGSLSNVDAGEWWVGSDPGQGLGQPLQAADGAFDSPSESMFAEIDVSAWANGHYSLFARGHDSSGNWGAPRGTRLSVTGNAVRVILSDSFEEAGFESWSEAVGGVSTGFEAAMAPDGGTNGMQAVVEDGTPSYLSHQTLPGETSYAASFYFDPNGTAMSSEPHDILQGLSRGTGIFGIQCAAAGEGAEYQVRGWVQAGGVVLHTNWYGIADAPHKLGLDWKSTAGTFALMVDDVVVEELTELNIGTLRLYEMRLGPSANLDATMSGVEYFDRFEALRMIRVVLPLIVH